MPRIICLGSWDDFSYFLDEQSLNFVEIRTASLTQSQIELLPALCQDLVTLELKITNNSYKLHRLGNLLSLTSLTLSGMNYRQSRLGVAMMALAPQLQNLSFDHVNGLDTADLRSLGQYCKHLGKIIKMYVLSICIYIVRMTYPSQLHNSKKHI